MCFIIIKNFCSLKDVIKKAKREVTDWEKCSQNIHLTNALYAEYLKKLLQLNNKTNNPI